MTNSNIKARLWVITELYAPDDAATANLMTQIAEHAAEGFRVFVLCAQPTYTHRGDTAERQECLNGVNVIRCKSTTFSKDKLLLRLVNVATIMASFFINMLFRFRRHDRVLVVTNPPPLPFAATIAAKIRGSKVTLLVHDIYPDVLVPTGITSEGTFLYRIVDSVNCWLFCRVESVISIGRCMKQRLVAKSDALGEKVTVVPNWYDSSFEVPKENALREELEFKDKFIVQYSGNMGRTHGLSVIAHAAELIEKQGRDDIHFMVCGWGGGKPRFIELVEKLNLRNLTVHAPYPRARLGELIGVADVSIISFIPGMSGISVPSRMYNVLAGGCPIIGVCDADSELALTLTDDQLGWVTPPEDPDALAKLVGKIADDAKSLDDMKERCRETVLDKFNRDRSLDAYMSVIAQRATNKKQV